MRAYLAIGLRVLLGLLGLAALCWAVVGLLVLGDRRAGRRRR
jgi:hypothetical protein